jgi:hypothetical protein
MTARLLRPLLASILLVSPARAQSDAPPSVAPPSAAKTEPTCGTTARSWIRIDQGDPAFVVAFRAEAATEGFDVCVDGGPTPPVAHVAIVTLEGSPTVDVLDVVTSKRVSRSVDLRSIPPDGRALALALAADELLHASWAELALTHPPPLSAPVPESVTRVVEASVRPQPAAPRTHAGEIGVMVAGEVFSGGQAQLGADARGQWFVTPHFAATLRLGLRSALPKATPEGEVRASAIIAGIGAAYRAAPSPNLDLGLFARFDALDVTYVADTTIDATASSGSALALLLGAGGTAGWSVLPALRLGAEVGATAPLRPVQATEGGTTVVIGMSGVGVVVGLGAGGLF